MILGMARLAAILTMTVAFAAYGVAAQKIALNQETAAPTGSRSGAYEGVSPTNSNPPAVSVPAGATPPQVTWPGFQMLTQGRSRVFLQLTSKAETAVESRSNQVVMILKNAQIAGRNNRRPLETRFFNTPVSRAWLKKRGADIALIIELRANALPNISAQQASTGYYFVFLDFPAGKYLDSATEAALPVTVGGAQSAEANRIAAKNAVEVSVSAKGAKPVAQKPVSAEQMRAIENEKPPILQHKVGGSIHIGR